ncbi:MAG: hypothetical protein ABEJ98_02095 [Candidatus Nanohaloarchaea archaeon]
MAELFAFIMLNQLKQGLKAMKEDYSYIKNVERNRLPNLSRKVWKLTELCFKVSYGPQFFWLWRASSKNLGQAAVYH